MAAPTIIPKNSEGKSNWSVLMGAAFIMATSAIGPGFLTQTAVFTEKFAANFAFAILASIIIDIGAQTDVPNTYEATFSICTLSGNGRSSETFYTGTVLYSDMLIRFSFVNQYNPLEEDLLYIFNPLERRSFTDGLLCGISSTDLMPCAFKCFITLKPQELTDNLQQHLLFTRAELQRWKKLNMLLIDNNAEGLI